MSDFAPDLAWMAWTWQTGVFFAVIASLLLAMVMAPRIQPQTLPTPITRGR